MRSPTAERVFAVWPGIETDSAGLAPDAETPLAADQVEWADLIFVMEKSQRAKLTRLFARQLKGKRVVCLDIPDNYGFMDPQLMRLLEEKAGRFLQSERPSCTDPV